MPTISISYENLCNLVGKKLPTDPFELQEVLLVCKSEVESINGDELKLEIKDSNRPDLFSAEGIAHVLKGYYGIEKGIERQNIGDSGVKIIVDSSVKKIRPYIVGGIVRGVKIRDIRRLMDLQEKIHQTHGQKRKRIAIGLYEIDKIKPPIHYKTTAPDENCYVPLGFDHPLTPREILEQHPKGREYGHLISGFDRYPLLIDDKGDVLSIPPIINSEKLGHITEETENIFIDVTGTDFSAISLALNVMAFTLSKNGGRIEWVELVYPDKRIKTPNFDTEEMKLNPDLCRKLIGIEISDEEIVDLLLRARFDAEIRKNGINVKIPTLRGDIISEVDLVEEIAVMYGFNRMEPEMPELSTVGMGDEIEERGDLFRELLIGLGFQEIMTFTLSNPENQFEKMRVEGKAVEIENPMVKTYSCFRSWLLPSLFEFLSRNTHARYPQKIFEVGDVVNFSEEEETGTKTTKKIAVCWADAKLNFTQMKSVAESILKNMGIVDYEFEEFQHPSFIDGRVVSIKTQREIGFFGEIHPEVLENWEIFVSVLALEMEVL
ncbi:MAG: phenylalanine--tRNA ligase subunit beta [Candidatus Syntropharchaeia archaeon]